jgi:hypothetical protein
MMMFLNLSHSHNHSLNPNLSRRRRQVLTTTTIIIMMVEDKGIRRMQEPHEDSPQYFLQ